MTQIKILNDSLINKIAAGEVIERPKNVVKELIENSIDAKASKITVEVKKGGKSFISVTDNGEGMNKKDAKKACLRHSTSKISNLDDLFNISSLGFRGEALASIVSVSKLTLTTRTENELEGIELKYESGNLKNVEKKGCPTGTAIIVKDLFYNTPARKKYLKSERREFNHIIDIIQRYSLINPKIHFKLIHNNKEILNSPQTSDQLTNISYIYGRKTAKKLLLIDYKSSLLTIKGYISKPEIARWGKKDQSIYINKRYIKNKTVSDAINNAYNTLMFLDKNPVVVLNISLDPEIVDVNVHPTKSEVRFEKEKEIYDHVFSAVRKTLLENDLIPDPELKKDSFTQYTFKNHEKNIDVKESSPGYSIEKSRQTLFGKEDNKIALNKLPEMRILGVLNKTYIVAETRNELILIDQHAAAERILYEKYLKQFQRKKIIKQVLLEPVLIETDKKMHESISQNLSVFTDMGFDIEAFGRNEFIVRSVPEIFKKAADNEFIIDLITSGKKSFKEKEQNKIMKMACRAAVKAGEEITIKEIKNFLSDLDNSKISYTCPHGRPILIKLSFREIEKMFKR
ncbi:DNA mismatch repair endonuclease MutL [Candidatus Woesearchaeota archaeon]|nr:DNA mismatch repair endonuclease MutL [Candidatus Woesearchaeota archaeon]